MNEPQLPPNYPAPNDGEPLSENAIFLIEQIAKRYKMSGSNSATFMGLYVSVMSNDQLNQYSVRGIIRECRKAWDKILPDSGEKIRWY